MKIIIPFLIFCLVAICNAELRTWTAVNGKEVEAEFVSNEKGIVKLKLKSGKVFEVPANKLSKEDNEFISSLDKPEGVNYDELEEREGIMYLKGSDTLYTGKVYELHDNGQKSYKGKYKEGKEDGLQTSWYENGQKESEGIYADGKENGLHTEWHDNGKKRMEGNYKDGKKDGLYVSWYESGQKEREGNYKDGEKEGLHVLWFSNGQKWSEENYNKGEVVQLQNYYKTGEKKMINRLGIGFNVWHKNGEKAVTMRFRAVQGTLEPLHEMEMKFWDEKGEEMDQEEGMKMMGEIESDS